MLSPLSRSPRFAAGLLAALALSLLFAVPSTASAQTDQASAKEAEEAGEAVPESGLNADSDRMADVNNPAADGSGEVVPLTATGAAGRTAGVLPTVRLTPRDVRMPGLWRGRLNLEGQWDFSHDVPENFDGNHESVAEWNKVQIPGHFARQGHERMKKEEGAKVVWHRGFDAPENWQGNVVRLRFESLDGLANVWVNGQHVGSRDVATLPSEYDITPHVKYGERNHITITVEWSLATHWSRRELGSIGRQVWLQALPPVNVARLHVAPDLHFTGMEDGKPDATMNIKLRVANDSDQPINDAVMKFELRGPGDETIALDLRDTGVKLPPIAAGQMLETMIPVPINDVVTWDPEHPRQHRLIGTLYRGDEEQMRVFRPFGFRESEVRGNQLFVNNNPVIFRGTNYHQTFPGFGYFMPGTLGHEDVRIFRDLNMNVLRVRPTPMIEYVESCDEIGMFTTLEGMFSLMMYDRGPLKDNGADPSIAPGVRFHMATMLESYASHPSIVTFGLANECAYFDYFREAAVGMQAETELPLFFGGDARTGVGGDFMDINDDHYPRDGLMNFDDLSTIEGKGWDYPKNRPNMFTEWCHLHANNIKEYLFDPGIDDYWGYYAQVHADWMFSQQHILGGFLFLGAPEVKVGATFRWRGFFDEWRRLYDHAYHVKKSHSPVRIADTDGVDLGDTKQFTVANRFDFYNLSELAFEWKQGAKSGKLELEGEPGSEVTFEVPFDASADTGVMLDIYTPTGRHVDAYELGKPLTFEAIDLPEQELAFDAEAGIVTVGDDTFTFDLQSGFLVEAKRGDTVVLSGPGEPVVRPSQFLNFRRQQKLTLVNQLFGWKADEVTVSRDGDNVVAKATGTYEKAEGTILTTVTPTGEVTISYDLIWTDGQEFNVFDAGFALHAAPEMSNLHWKRDAQWTVYPDDHIGRPIGTAPASGDPQYDAARAAHPGAGKAASPWPWSQDIISGASNDFRSTKMNFFRGGLHNDAGVGVEVVRTGERQHLHAFPSADEMGGEVFVSEFHGPATDDRGNGYFLQVTNFHSGGTEPHLTKSHRFDRLRTYPEMPVSGTVTFRLTDTPAASFRLPVTACLLTPADR